MGTLQHPERMVRPKADSVSLTISTKGQLIKKILIDERNKMPKSPSKYSKSLPNYEGFDF